MNPGSILSLLLSFVLLIIGLNWFFNPLSAANSLNMNLFDGYGLNTQIRDFTSLFLATSILCFISFITRQYQWIFASGIIFLTITTLHIIGVRIELFEGCRARGDSPLPILNSSNAMISLLP